MEDSVLAIVGLPSGVIIGSFVIGGDKFPTPHSSMRVRKNVRPRGLEVDGTAEPLTGRMESLIAVRQPARHGGTHEPCSRTDCLSLAMAPNSGLRQLCQPAEADYSLRHAVPQDRPPQKGGPGWQR